MLAEMLLYRLARTEKWVDRIGYRAGAVRLWSRYGRCKKIWAPHLENTRRFVHDAALASQGRKTALVFGSGLLADLPLDELCVQFDRVELVDIVHLPSARWRTRRFANVHHRVCDLTGVGAGLVAGDLPVPQGTYGLGDTGVDFVVSLNLISQLPLAAIDWLESHRGWAAERCEAYGAQIVAAHLAHLRAFDCPVCLVGDAARSSLPKSGTPAERQDALFGVALPTPDAAWDWDLAPLGEISGEYAVRNHVVAIRELRDSTKIV
jgi:hypothetical protein